MKATHLTTGIVDADALIALVNRDDLHAAAVFSFGEWHTIQGFTLVADL